MLEAVHSGSGHFAGANGIRNVSFKRNFLFLGFGGNGEDSVARDERLQLDEINATTFQFVNGAGTIFGSGDGDGIGEARLGAIEHGAGGQDSWTDEASTLDFVAPGLNSFEIAAHIAHAGDAIGDEKRQGNFLGEGKPVAKGEMDVHVPEARDEVAAFGADTGSVARVTSAFAADGVDAIALNDDDLVAANLAGADVDDVDVGDDEGVFEGPMLLGRGSRRPKQKHREKREGSDTRGEETEKGGHKASLSREGEDSTRKALG